MRKKSYFNKLIQLCLVTFLTIVTCTYVTGQSYNWNKQLKKSIAPTSLALVSGAAGGLHEGLQFRRVEFFKRFPNANRSYWDTNVSSLQQRWILGQAQAAYHHAANLQIGCAFLAGGFAGVNIAMPLIKKEKNPWWHTALDIGINSASLSLGYFAGQVIIYDGLLHK